MKFQNVCPLHLFPFVTSFPRFYFLLSIVHCIFSVCCIFSIDPLGWCQESSSVAPFLKMELSSVHCVIFCGTSLTVVTLPQKVELKRKKWLIFKNNYPNVVFFKQEPYIWEERHICSSSPVKDSIWWAEEVWQVLLEVLICQHIISIPLVIVTPYIQIIIDVLYPKSTFEVFLAPTPMSTTITKTIQGVLRRRRDQQSSQHKGNLFPGWQ